jgi:hypothetical protein
MIRKRGQVTLGVALDRAHRRRDLRRGLEERGRVRQSASFPEAGSLGSRRVRLATMRLRAADCSCEAPAASPPRSRSATSNARAPSWRPSLGSVRSPAPALPPRHAPRWSGCAATLRPFAPAAAQRDASRGRDKLGLAVPAASFRLLDQRLGFSSREDFAANANSTNAPMKMR